MVGLTVFFPQTFLQQKTRLDVVRDHNGVVYVELAKEEIGIFSHKIIICSAMEVIDKDSG